MLDDIRIPQASPARKVAGYQMPEDITNLLSWDFVSQHMTASQHYWLTTVSAQGRPHAVPVWGVESQAFLPPTIIKLAGY